MDAVRVNPQLFVIAASASDKGAVELVNVEEPIRNTAEPAVAQEVVLLIGIERPRNEGPKDPLAVSFCKQPSDLAAEVRSQNAQNIRITLDEAPSNKLVDLVLLPARRERGWVL